MNLRWSLDLGLMQNRIWFNSRLWCKDSYFCVVQCMFIISVLTGALWDSWNSECEAQWITFLHTSVELTQWWKNLYIISSLFHDYFTHPDTPSLFTYTVQRLTASSTRTQLPNATYYTLSKCPPFLRVCKCDPTVCNSLRSAAL